jgi:hypothetical protein
MKNEVLNSREIDIKMSDLLFSIIFIITLVSLLSFLNNPINNPNSKIPLNHKDIPDASYVYGGLHGKYEVYAHFLWWSTLIGEGNFLNKLSFNYNGNQVSNVKWTYWAKACNPSGTGPSGPISCVNYNGPYSVPGKVAYSVNFNPVFTTSTVYGCYTGRYYSNVVGYDNGHVHGKFEYFETLQYNNALINIIQSIVDQGEE